MTSRLSYHLSVCGLSDMSVSRIRLGCLLFITLWVSFTSSQSNWGRLWLFSLLVRLVPYHYSDFQSFLPTATLLWEGMWLSYCLVKLRRRYWMHIDDHYHLHTSVFETCAPAFYRIRVYTKPRSSFLLRFPKKCCLTTHDCSMLSSMFCFNK